MIDEQIVPAFVCCLIHDCDFQGDGGHGGGRKSRRGLTSMSLNESQRGGNDRSACNSNVSGGGGSAGGHGVTQDARSQVSMDGSSVVTATGRKSNWEVIEHYRNSGEPASLMATTSHTGVARIDSTKGGDSSFAQNSCTGVEDPASNDTQSTDESILKDHSENWWNLWALCLRVFR